MRVSVGDVFQYSLPGAGKGCACFCCVMSLYPVCVYCGLLAVGRMIDVLPDTDMLMCKTEYFVSFSFHIGMVSSRLCPAVLCLALLCCLFMLLFCVVLVRCYYDDNFVPANALLLLATLPLCLHQGRNIPDVRPRRAHGVRLLQRTRPPGGGQDHARERQKGERTPSKQTNVSKTEGKKKRQHLKKTKS